MGDQAFLEIPTSTPNDESALIQESDDDDEVGLSSNSDTFAFENNSLSATSEAQRDFGSARGFPEFDQGIMLEPFDLSLQHSHDVPSTYIPMPETHESGLQDSVLNQNPGAVDDVFAIDHQWNEDAIALSPGDVGSNSNDPHITGQRVESRTVLTLYNVEPGTLNTILDTAFRSKTRIKMKTYH